MLYRNRKTYPRIYGLGNGPRSSGLRLRLSLQKFTTRIWYQLVSFKADENLVFMNFGYAPADPGVNRLELDPSDERNRDTIQLYNRVSGAVDLHDKDVLEVGSGRGGGAAFISKYLHPRSTTGLDFCGRAVAFCTKRHGAKELSYVQGDAENLPFPDESYDVVVNVESCHCYLSVDRFIEQVKRVLRPGGHFLITDMGPKPYVDTLREKLGNCGLAMIEVENITPQVVRALELTSVRNAKDIKEQVPPGLRTTFSNFAGITGTPVFEALRSGEWEYVRFVLRKD